jgi:hypothetical protein
MGDDELQGRLAIELEQHVSMSESQLDLEQMRRPVFHIIYGDITLTITQYPFKSFVLMGISSIASVYILLLTYKLAEDFYIVTAIRSGLMFVSWVWILLVACRSGVKVLKAA